MIPMTLCKVILTAVLGDAFLESYLIKTLVLPGYQQCNVGLCVAMIHYGFFLIQVPRRREEKGSQIARCLIILMERLLYIFV